MKKPQVFISYSGHDSFEASLLQFAVESILKPDAVTAWTYQRDQVRSEKQIAAALKDRVRKSFAVIFLVSPSTLDSGAAQWMELAYADAFGVRTFVVLHHLDFQQLKSRERGVPPLLLASQCNEARNWRAILRDVRKIVKRRGKR